MFSSMACWSLSLRDHGDVTQAPSFERLPFSLSSLSSRRLASKSSKKEERSKGTSTCCCKLRVPRYLNSERTEGLPVAGRQRPAQPAQHSTRPQPEHPPVSGIGPSRIKDERAIHDLHAVPRWILSSVPCGSPRQGGRNPGSASCSSCNPEDNP